MPPEKPDGPDELDEPQAPGAEMSFSTCLQPHLGQGGGGASRLKMIFSYLALHFVQRYSKIGMVS